jgi:hypothetical protein
VKRTEYEDREPMDGDDDDDNDGVIIIIIVSGKKEPNENRKM